MSTCNFLKTYINNFRRARCKLRKKKLRTCDTPSATCNVFQSSSLRCKLQGKSPRVTWPLVSFVRQHVPCFYRVMETRVEVWENEKCCGNTSRRRVFPQLLRVLPNFHECFYNSIETRRTCFLFLLENTATKKKKNENNLLTSRYHYVNSAC